MQVRFRSGSVLRVIVLSIEGAPMHWYIDDHFSRPQGRFHG